MKRVFRFDDVCLNSDIDETNAMVQLFLEKFPDAEVLLGVSPLVHDLSHEPGGPRERERVYPKILNVSNDYRDFYAADYLGIPDGLILGPSIHLATHGIVHVDHRLLPREVQEMSILISASVLKAKVFIPPHNQWDKNTEAICAEYGIELVKFEDGWLSIEHNPWIESQEKWYLHARNVPLEDLRAWLEG